MGNEMEIIEILKRTYGNARPELNYSNPFELMIAVVLSAQCTDVRVNMVTESLFEDVKCPGDIVSMGVSSLEDRIRTCGLYRNKARNIFDACVILDEKYGGGMPETIEKLMELPGVGRKSANVIASNAFGIPAIAVDTHVFRVSNRLGLADAKNVTGTENDLMRVIPREDWTFMHHVLIFHGRRICKARKPMCGDCPVEALCKARKDGTV
jgi:endonuclease III